MPTIQGQEFGNGVLLLKETDRVMAGIISERGEYYEIELAPDSRVSIPKQNVAHVAGSLEELYQAKRRSNGRWNAGDHYQLTRWCLLNNLLEHAAEHYAETAKRSPDHPRVRQLGVELQERMLQDESFRQYLGLSPTTSPTATTFSNSDSRPTVLAELLEKPIVVTTSTIESKVTAGEVNVHPEITRRFTERVQPILLNRCSQAACHGAQSSNALLLTPPYSSAASRITSENLASVLKQVSTNPSHVSPLIQRATQAHGIQPAPAIAMSETRLLQEMESWIAFVRNPVVSAVVTNSVPLGSQVRTAEQFRLEPYATAVTLIPVDPGASQLRAVPRDAVSTTQVGSEAHFPSSVFPVGSQPPSPAEIDALDAQLKAALGELPPPTSASSDDPFDPAEFNRRFK